MSRDTSGKPRRSKLASLARLVRAPAALTVPGDILAGAAATGRASGPALLGRMVSSICLYWAGMALNDYADRELDAKERPNRPIPSGEISPGEALGVAVGLTTAGVALALAADGKRGLATVLPLAGAVWAYDLTLKSSPISPISMAATRFLNVLAGASPGRMRQAVPAALLTGLHTATVSLLSKYEVEGAPMAVPGVALTATGLVAAGAVLNGATARPADQASALVLAGGYAANGIRSQLMAVADPSPRNVQGAVASGIHGLTLLQAALTARAGSPGTALGIATAFPVTRQLGKRTSPT
ncbi:SCO3242 family prenyltransferase [Nonomuraea typhae]|uniref:SCO3242 family prenyltransferase n=1 Tax=Nonomuraea typhae TaxID=2603600 RepID=A0ABW7Z9C7_9ACTN